ncbi:ileal sodium/bile acid cotransporter-like [Condylostylus longicornis]|uniref:ileal sodium/bile acid cotransporter-like n=1 Tax=Condylostylus longicornis TaxID=2530218 RepID=UPI00244DAFAD|nr:ileal sodium/bile acid cotransporter-like [Condylostylus longicornis]
MRKSVFYFTIFFLIVNVVGQHGLTDQEKWKVSFSDLNITIHMDEEAQSKLKINLFDEQLKGSKFRLKSEKTHISTVPDEYIHLNGSSWEGYVLVKGVFLGKTKICVELILSNNQSEISSNCQDIIVIRKMRIIDHVFTGSVALLVSLLYINFGAALDLSVLKGILKKPVGPAIGCFCQFILMPVMSYALGYALFATDINMWLGLFFTGVSPGGGASNMWTVILKGNINLSIVMTTISNLGAFAMMPLWIFTLGKTIFDYGDLKIPYDRIATFAVSLVVPLLIGIGIQKFLPRIARVLSRLLRPISAILIIFIIIFATVTNLYLFELFSWQIVVAGLGLPWLTYCLSWCVAKLLKQNDIDCLAIAIEAGIQNTGIAIFMLRFSLGQPEADLTTVIPVSVAIMTPIPLFLLYLVQKVRSCRRNAKGLQEIENDNE